MATFYHNRPSAEILSLSDVYLTSVVSVSSLFIMASHSKSFVCEYFKIDETDLDELIWAECLVFKGSLKAMLHGAIFLATCNAILLLRDVKLPKYESSLHSADVFSTYRKFFTDFTN